jgi:RNA polymerase sigma factor (sigma-70 family)
MAIDEGAAVLAKRADLDVPVMSRLGQLRPDLLAVARSILLDDDEAQDVVQATLEIALRRAGDLRSFEALMPWLFRIETREALRLARRARRLVHFGWGDLPDKADRHDAQLGVEVREALAKLPVRIRAAIVLHYMADLPVAETAEALGVSTNTVKTQLKRGLTLLREELGDVR